MDINMDNIVLEGWHITTQHLPTDIAYRHWNEHGCDPSFAVFIEDARIPTYLSFDHETWEWYDECRDDCARNTEDYKGRVVAWHELPAVPDDLLKVAENWPLKPSESEDDCDFCRNFNFNLVGYNDTIPTKPRITFGENIADHIHFHYCPVCGRKLDL